MPVKTLCYMGHQDRQEEMQIRQMQKLTDFLTTPVLSFLMSRISVAKYQDNILRINFLEVISYRSTGIIHTEPYGFRH